MDSLTPLGSDSLSFHGSDGKKKQKLRCFDMKL